MRDVIKAHGGMTKLVEEIERNRENLYKPFSTRGNPGINTLVDALDVFGLELQVKAIPASKSKENEEKDWISLCQENLRRWSLIGC